MKTRPSDPCDPASDRLSLGLQLTRAPLASLLALLGLVLCGPYVPSRAADLSEAEARGKYIYETGRSRSRRVINANTGKDGAPTPGHVLPCINCHGADGRGAEDYAGIAPLNVNWYALASAGVHRHAVRSHQAFDELSLARSIVLGKDPAGHDLEKAMPRYDMAQDDVQDLIAYLKVMDSQSDPAISGDAIRVGTVIPVAGQHAGLGKAIRQTLDAVFDEVNARGGVNQRKLVLAVGGWSDNGNPEIWAARDLVNQQPVLALVSPYVPNYDAELEALASETRTAVVGPYTVLQPDGGEAGDNPFTFYLTAGLSLQARALVDAAAARTDPAVTPLAIVYPRVQFFTELAAGAARYAASRGFTSVQERVYEAGALQEQAMVADLGEADTGAMLFLGGGVDLARLARRADQAAWEPLLLSPAVLVERQIFDLPERFSGRVLLAYASLPTDYSRQGTEAFERLHEEHGFDYRYSIAQVNAYLAATVLVEALQRAGRDLNRGALVTAFEGLDNFHPGLAPALSYYEGRRIGSTGVHIVPVDLVEDRFNMPLSWIDPAEDD